MLRLRICPKCQRETRSLRAYFCHRCGARLPPPPGQPEAGKEKASGVGRSEVKKERKRGRVPTVVAAAALGAALLLAVALVAVYYFQIRPPRPSLPSSSPPRNEAFVADVSFEVANYPFSAKGLSEMVPADVDLYLESRDPELVLPALIPSEEWAQVESVLTEQIGLNADEAASFLEDEFAVVMESTASAFLAKARDIDFLEQKISEVGEYEGWEAKLVEGFLIISNSPNLTRSIEEAQKKLTLNLSLTSGFTGARKKLPQTGQVFYYGKKRLEFIPSSIKGEAFVISKKNGGILITGL